MFNQLSISSDIRDRTFHIQGEVFVLKLPGESREVQKLIKKHGQDHVHLFYVNSNVEMLHYAVNLAAMVRSTPSFTPTSEMIYDMSRFGFDAEGDFVLGAYSPHLVNPERLITL